MRDIKSLIKWIDENRENQDIRENFKKFVLFLQDYNENHKKLKLIVDESIYITEIKEWHISYNYKFKDAKFSIDFTEGPKFIILDYITIKSLKKIDEKIYSLKDERTGEEIIFEPLI